MSHPTLSLPPAPRGVLVAALALDEATEVVARAAAELANENDLELRLVHVIAPVGTEPLYYNAASVWTAMHPFQEFMAETAQRQKGQLSSLLGKLGLQRPGVVDVIFGDTVATISDYCRAHRANLVLAGVDVEGYGAMSAGFSTVLGLMTHAPLPVLAVRTKAPPKLGRGAKILIADDLETATEEAVRRGFEFAVKVGAAAVRQLHVAPDLGILLHAAWRDADLLEREMAADRGTRLATLERRAIPHRELARAAGATVDAEVRFGSAAAEIMREIATFRPDLVVFGRHKAIHKRGHLLGRMTCRAMLEAQTSVLVVPPADELFVNLALPGRMRAVGEKK